MCKAITDFDITGAPLITIAAILINDSSQQMKQMKLKSQSTTDCHHGMVLYCAPRLQSSHAVR